MDREDNPHQRIFVGCENEIITWVPEPYANSGGGVRPYRVLPSVMNGDPHVSQTQGIHTRISIVYMLLKFGLWSFVKDCDLWVDL